MLAFVRHSALDPALLATLRASLAELDAELVVLTEHGVWSVRPHDETVHFSDKLAGDVATAAMLYGVSGDAVFVVDGRGVVRFAHRPEQSVAAGLVDAIAAACREMRGRQRHGKLERVRYTRREWAMHSLVTGCAAVFGAPASATGSSPRIALPGTPVAPALAIGSAPIAVVTPSDDHR
ncbi:MAG TPA: hypothetical protein VFQ53_23560 [Kofleriaceae bacterium]|nr:hypothetical protein [Kofleriaceae bacterium]